jgi:hypothetical protein
MMERNIKMLEVPTGDAKGIYPGRNLWRRRSWNVG